MIEMTEKLFDRSFQVSDKDLESFADLLPTAPLGVNIVDDLVSTGLASSKAEARKFIKAGAVSLNGEKVLEETRVVNAPALLKKGKNKFALVR